MDKAQGKQGDNKQFMLLPMTPKMDDSATQAPPKGTDTPAGADQSMPATAADRREKASAPAKQTLNEEALSLLDQYSTKAKSDCFSLIQLVSKQPVSEDTIMDGKIPVADVNTMDIPAINQQARLLSDDLSAMQKITASSAPPQSELPNKQDYWQQYWGQAKNNTGAALLNANDVVSDLKTFDSPSPNAGRLADDAVSAYQALNDAQGGIVHLLTSSKKDWNHLWELQANKGVISPLSKVNEATNNLYSAKLRLEIASRIDPEIWKSGAAMILRGAGTPYGIGAALGIGVTLFRSAKASISNNKIGGEALNEIKACVNTFHEAERQCDDFLANSASKADAASLQKIKHFDEELKQVLPELDELNKKTQKHPHWKELNKEISGLVTDERIQDLGVQSRAALNQFEDASDR